MKSATRQKIDAKRRSPEYQREMSRRIRTRERLGDKFIYRSHDGQVVTEPANGSKWDAETMREYKREWMRRNRAIQRCSKMLKLLADAARMHLVPGFLMGFRCGVLVERARKRR